MRRDADIAARVAHRALVEAASRATTPPITEWTLIYLEPAGTVLAVAADEADEFLALMGRRRRAP